jgi:hypothetical protein
MQGCRLRRIHLLGTGVKIVSAVVLFHSFGVARQGPWVTWMSKSINRARAYKDPGPVDDLPPYPAALQTTGGVYRASYSPRLHPATGLVCSG